MERSWSTSVLQSAPEWADFGPCLASSVPQKVRTLRRNRWQQLMLGILFLTLRMTAIGNKTSGNKTRLIVWNPWNSITITSTFIIFPCIHSYFRKACFHFSHQRVKESSLMHWPYDLLSSVESSRNDITLCLEGPCPSCILIQLPWEHAWAG